MPTPPERRVLRRLSADKLAEVVRRYQDGEASTALASEFGLSKTVVIALLRGEGVEIRRQPLPADKVCVAVYAYSQGVDITCIAKKLNTTYNNVRLNLIREGVSMRPRGGSRSPRQ